MKAGQLHLSSAEELRRAFDETFTRPPEERASDEEDVLAVRLANEPYVIRLSEVAGVHLRRKVVPLPSSLNELAGVAALRGVLVPVYDLAQLLGYPAATTSTQAFVLARAAKPIAFACGVPERLVRIPRSAFAALTEGAPQRAHLSGLVRVVDALRPVIDLPSLVHTIERAILNKARSSE